MFNKLSKNTSFLGIDEARYIYKVLCRKRLIHQLKIRNKYSKNRLILLTNIFERDIFAFEVCNLQAAFLIGRIELKMTSDLFETFNNHQKLAYEIGNFIFSNNKKFSFCLLKSVLKNFVKWLILFFTSIDSLS